MYEAYELHKKSTNSIKKTKDKFKQIIKYINKNKNSLTPKIKSNLKCLIQLWKNNSDTNKYYFMNMTEYNQHITGHIEDPLLKTMWDDYIVCYSVCYTVCYSDCIRELENA
jgi:hypothetical protein